MLRSFPTRFPNSRIGVVLLIPCLLICLACATPFPVESLEKGMTAETVREKFGAPEATNLRWDITSQGGRMLPVLTGESWTYTHEIQNWVTTLTPLTPLFVPVLRLTGEDESRWDYLYVHRTPVVLHFRAENLISWNVGPGIDYSGDPEVSRQWVERQMEEQMREMQRMCPTCVYSPW
jgi:hypothetical protein